MIKLQFSNLQILEKRDSYKLMKCYCLMNKIYHLYHLDKYRFYHLMTTEYYLNDLSNSNHSFNILSENL